MEKRLRNICEININNFDVDISVQERRDLAKIINWVQENVESERDEKQVEKICIEIFEQTKMGELPGYPLSREFGISEEHYSEYRDFTYALWKLMKKMQKSGHADDFIRYIETGRRTAEDSISKQKSIENGKSQKTPVSFSDINKNNDAMLELIGRLNVLEGYDGNEEMTMAELIESDLFIHVLNANNISVEIDGYVSDIIKRMAGGRSAGA